jgi:heat shock protein HtpX
MNDAPLEWYLRQAWRDTVTASPFVAIGTGVWLFVAYGFHQSMIDAITGGHEVTRQEQPRLYNLLENLCISRGIPMPTLKIMDSNALNAFATGLSQKQYSITVTTGLLAHLNDAEMEAVLGHELTHIRNGDVRLLVIAGVIAGVISFFGELVFRTVFRSGFSSGRSSSSDRKGGAGMAILIAVALMVLAWVLSLVIRFALSRSREFLADAGSVELTKNPDAMISALRKIENRGELQRANSAIMEMCVDNPRTGLSDLFATHPSIDRRVKALTEFAGGHDPGPLAIAENEGDPPLPDATPSADTTSADAPSGASGPWGSAPAEPANGSGGPWSADAIDRAAAKPQTNL